MTSAAERLEPRDIGSSRVVVETAPPARELSIAELVLARVRALTQRRRAWLEHLDRRGSSELPGLGRGGPEDDDLPDAERRWAAGEPLLFALNATLEAHTAALAEDTDSSLARLSALFGLTQAERDALHVCLALELEPNLASVYALLQQNSARPYVTEAFAARLTGHPRGPLLGPSSPLVRWQILEICEMAPGEPRALRLDPHILDFLCERVTLDPALFDVASVVTPLPALPNWPVAALAQKLERAMPSSKFVRVTIVGPRGSGRRTFAAGVAAALGSRALAIDTALIADADWPRLFLRAERQALLVDMSLVWHGGGIARRRPPLPGNTPLQFVIAEGDFAPPPEPVVVDEQLAMPRLTIAERALLWQRFCPAARAWPDGELSAIAERFRLEIGDLAAIGRRAPSNCREARELCRLSTRDRLGELGQLLDCPFGREDLVLPEALDQRIDELLFEARDRTRFWEGTAARRLFPRGTGLIVLLAGPPGTGKTMTAQVLAAELGLDLFRIDLATSISKYIGETAKNLQRIFARAEEMNAVLLFDEADALFSKRTDIRDSHDRYANTDTNYLLQLLEAFSGIALLSSNKRENMDTAFARRIRYILEFPRPTEQERKRIWSRLVTELAGESLLLELGPALDRLARWVEMSGAQIKVSVLAAVFVARRAGAPLALPHLLHGVARELAKEGRGISPKDRERIERHE